MSAFNKDSYFWIFLIILFLGAFLRFYDLHSAPPGLHPDEAMNANEALLAPGQIFYPENAGREGLYINLVSLSFKILKPSPFSLRATSVFIGSLSIIGLFFFTREVFLFLGFTLKKAKLISLFASFFLAISFWHINFSRMGIRGILLPFFLVFCFYFLIRGIRTERLISFLFSGILFGLGFYGYTSFRMVIFILPFVFFFYFIIAFKKQRIKNFLINSFIFTLAALIIILPLVFYFSTHPDLFFGRFDEISFLFGQNNEKFILEASIAHLLMFNFIGDDYQYNFSHSPQLFLPVGILFILGILLGFKTWFFAHLNKNLKRLLICYLFASWFFAMLLPGILTSTTAHSLRTIGVIPIVYIIAGAAAFYLLQKIKRIRWFSRRKIAISFFIFLIGVSLFFFQFYKYFYKFSKSPIVKGAFGERIANIGIFINQLPDDVKKYVIVNEGNRPVPYPYGPPLAAQTIIFIERVRHGENRALYLKEGDIGSLASIGSNSVVIPVWPSDQIIDEIKVLNPKFELFSIDSFNKALIVPR